MFSKKLKSLVDKIKEEVPGISEKLNNLSKDAPSWEGARDLIMGSETQAPDWQERPHPPTVGFMSLLTGIKVKPETGLLEITSLEMYHLPSKDTEGNKLNYEPSTTNPDKLLLRVDLVKEQSGKIVTFYLCASQIHQVISTVTVFHGQGEKFQSRIELRESGSYEMQFFLADRHFHTYQFDLCIKPIEDPYSPVPKLYTIGGWWEELAFLQMTRDDIGGNFNVRFYPIINYQGVHIRSERQILINNGKAKMKCYLKKGQQIIGSVCMEENPSADIFDDPHTPGFFDYSLYVDKKLPSEANSLCFLKLPKTEKGSDHHVKAKELADGEYTIVIEMQEMQDRPDFERSYSLEIKDGRPIPFDRSNRQKHQNPTTYIEAGRDYVLITSQYIKRKLYHVTQ